MVERSHCYKWKPDSFFLETKHTQIKCDNLIKPLVQNNILGVKLLNFSKGSDIIQCISNSDYIHLF